jgi:hypothetical protein
VDTTLQCRSCHEPARLGALPRTHQGWADRTCITCHKQSTKSVPVAPHELSERVGLCSFCHEGSSFKPDAGGAIDGESGPEEGNGDTDDFGVTIPQDEGEASEPNETPDGDEGWIPVSPSPVVGDGTPGT